MQRRKYALLKQPFELDALGDVSLTNPVLGDVMYYDGSFWINTPYAELVDDRVAALLVAGNNIDLTYNDGANTLTIDVEPLTSADLSDFTEAAQDAVGAMVSTAGTGVDLAYNDATPALTASLDINGLTADATPDGTADYVATWDASASTHKKVLLNNLPGGGSGNVATDAIWDAAGDLAVGTGANTAARLAIGTEGQVLTVSSGAVAWAAAAGGASEQFVYKAANTSRTSTTTLADDPDLAVTLSANSVYEFEFNVFSDLKSAPGIKLTPAFSGTTTWAALYGMLTHNNNAGYSASAVGSAANHWVNNAVNLTIGFTGFNVTAIFRFTGTLSVGASGGTLSLQWAQQASSATAARVDRGSFMRVKKVA